MGLDIDIEPLFRIYFHRNKINNKVYIGITSLSLKDRFGKNGNNYKHNKHFWNAIQKYGWDNFEHIVFMENLSHEKACRYEQLLIALWQTNNSAYGYNKSIGGEVSALGICHSEESKTNMRNVKLGNKNPMFGANHTDEWKANMSDKMSGVNAPWYGKHLPDEMKLKISESNKNKTPWNKGLKMDEEFIDKLCIPVYCYEMDMYFKSLTEAGLAVGIGNQHISCCCNNKAKHAGRHPITGVKLSWRYATKEEYNDWLNQQREV